MDRINEAAAGGSGRRRMSGGAAVTRAGAEGVALLSIGASAARRARTDARAAAR